MGIELKMPALSPTMEEGTLAKWLVKEGDDVKSGDILAEIETDKATMEFEAVDEGKIAKILVPEGTDGVKVGQPIAIMAGDGDAAEAAPTAEAPKPAMTAEPSVPAPESQQTEATPSDPGGLSHREWVQAWREAVLVAPIALGLVELPSSQFIELSPRAADLLGTTCEDGVGLDYLTIVEPRREVEQTFRLVSAGALDG